MSVIDLGRLVRSQAARAAIIGATRALEGAYPVSFAEALPDRLSEAVAALMQADVAAATETH